MTWHDFNTSALPKTPWKNGGGSTTELVRWPENATLDNFIWRVSIATIASDGPFSRFESVDRIIALIQGPGVCLRDTVAGVDHKLDQPMRAFAFAGEASIYCTAGSAVSRDFNTMTRRGRATAEVVGLSKRAQMRTPRHGLFLATAGQWHISDGIELTRDVRSDQGVWWHDVRADSPISLVPQEDESTLLWVAIKVQGDDNCK